MTTLNDRLILVMQRYPRSQVSRVLERGESGRDFEQCIEPLSSFHIVAVRLWDNLSPRVDKLVVSLLLRTVVIEEKVVAEDGVGICHALYGLRLQILLRQQVGRVIV